MALMGCFADASGVVVGTPFEIGTATLDLIAPDGAASLQLGINDDRFYDNVGAFSVNVTVIPEPSTVVLFGIAGFLSLRHKHR